MALFSYIPHPQTVLENAGGVSVASQSVLHPVGTTLPQMLCWGVRMQQILEGDTGQVPNVGITRNIDHQMG